MLDHRYPEPSLLILQFGINVVPAKTEDFTYYANYLKVQLEYLKGQHPGMPILLIGVSDMGRMQEGLRTAYQTVEEVSRSQKKAAKESGAAFFDLLSFMGGPGSFSKWIEYDPPLMRRDLTHFTFEGGRIVGEGIALALISEVKNSMKPD